jgi:hypothetical protein
VWRRTDIIPAQRIGNFSKLGRAGVFLAGFACPKRGDGEMDVMFSANAADRFLQRRHGCNVYKMDLFLYHLNNLGERVCEAAKPPHTPPASPDY